MAARNARRGSRTRPGNHDDGGYAFLKDYRRGFEPSKDRDVEAYGEEFVFAAVSNESFEDVVRDELPHVELEDIARALDDVEPLEEVDLS